MDKLSQSMEEYVRTLKKFSVPDLQHSFEVDYLTASTFVAELVERKRARYEGGLLYSYLEVDPQEGQEDIQNPEGDADSDDFFDVDDLFSSLDDDDDEDDDDDLPRPPLPEEWRDLDDELFGWQYEDAFDRRYFDFAVRKNSLEVTAKNIWYKTGSAVILLIKRDGDKAMLCDDGFAYRVLTEMGESHEQALKKIRRRFPAKSFKINGENEIELEIDDCEACMALFYRMYWLIDGLLKKSDFLF